LGRRPALSRYIAALKITGLEASPERHRELLELARRLLQPLGCRVVDVRISSRRVEVDAFAAGPEALVQALSIVAPLEYVRGVSGELVLPEEDLLLFAARLFDEERFWEAHEVLEQVWRSKRGKEREVLSGLIKLAAAYVHLQRGRRDGFFRLLTAALGHLSRWGPARYWSIDVERLASDVRRLIESHSTGLLKLPR